MKNLVFIICLSGCSAVWAQDADEETPDSTSAAAESESGRLSVRTDLSDRGDALARFEQVIWFDAGGARRWMVMRDALAAAQGAVLLVAAEGAGANGFAHLATLRRVLPNVGWSTYYLQLPADETDIADAIISAARSKLTEVGRLLIMCEGLSCDVLLDTDTATVAGTAFINVRLSGDTRVSAADKQRWRDASTPALVLQEQPLGWPSELVPAAGFELHLLPQGNPSRENSKVVRKLRGWMKRRLEAG